MNQLFQSSLKPNSINSKSNYTKLDQVPKQIAAELELNRIATQSKRMNDSNTGWRRNKNRNNSRSNNQTILTNSRSSNSYFSNVQTFESSILLEQCGCHKGHSSDEPTATSHRLLIKCVH